MVVVVEAAAASDPLEMLGEVVILAGQEMLVVLALMATQAIMEI